nr:MAG TPA: hypothetical protein [Caudoviricetes sp.]
MRSPRINKDDRVGHFRGYLRFVCVRGGHVPLRA